MENIQNAFVTIPIITSSICLALSIVFYLKGKKSFKEAKDLEKYVGREILSLEIMEMHIARRSMKKPKKSRQINQDGLDLDWEDTII